MNLYTCSRGRVLRMVRQRRWTAPRGTGREVLHLFSPAVWLVQVPSPAAAPRQLKPPPSPLPVLNTEASSVVPDMTLVDGVGGGVADNASPKTVGVTGMQQGKAPSDPDDNLPPASPASLARSIAVQHPSSRHGGKGTPRVFLSVASMSSPRRLDTPGSSSRVRTAALLFSAADAGDALAEGDTSRRPPGLPTLALPSEFETTSSTRLSTPRKAAVVLAPSGSNRSGPTTTSSAEVPACDAPANTASPSRR